MKTLTMKVSDKSDAITIAVSFEDFENKGPEELKVTGAKLRDAMLVMAHELYSTIDSEFGKIEVTEAQP